jgi:LacI family transcriptional regulator
MATIRDVAEYAGVSVSTVSHVINGTRFVDPDTEQRVRVAIGVLKYRPNSVARSLRRRETNTIGLIVPDNSNPFFAEVARAIEDCGFAESYNVILCNSDGSEEKEKAYVDVLLSKRVDGLILISSSHYSDHLKHIMDMQIPVVVVDRELGDVPVAQVMVDNEYGGYLAGQYLLSLGHRRIGCIAGPSELTPSHGRVHGLQRALNDAGCDLPDDALEPGDFRYGGGEAAMKTLLSRKLNLTAVFAINDVMAIGAINVLRRARLRVPEAVSVIGFDNIPQSAMMWPPITTIAQPILELGQASISLLLDQIRQADRVPTRILLQPALVVRESCHAVSD